MEVEVEELLERAVSRIQQPVVMSEHSKSDSSDTQMDRILEETKPSLPSKQHERDKCTRCSKFPKHSRKDCKARDAKCRNCGKIGHYYYVCKTSKTHTLTSQE